MIFQLYSFEVSSLILCRITERKGRACLLRLVLASGRGRKTMNSKSIWGKRLLSLVSAAYCAMVCWFSYLALFYEVSIPNKAAFCGVFSAVSLAALIAMLYSRFQILTRLSSIVMLPAALPFILICFGKWEVILPIAVTALVIFFLSGAGETTKTIFGVIYLLLYVLGSLGYFMVMSFFASPANQSILESGTSPSQVYRYEVIQTEDSSGGNLAIHVEPNELDIDLPLISFVAVGYDRTVYLERPLQENVQAVTWTTVSRAEITQQLLAISDDLELDLNDTQKAVLGVSADDTVYLRDLSDAQLEQLGVPEDNDVLTYGDEVCFRSYIAVLEEYFAPEKRQFSLF